ncbi:OsmC family peroxiredoxin [Candidatus Amarolinea dominans]|uniref:OsmC family peroxiredoxin n=1 Tax=Candidatus Amarolinea dominans TaxID=3140696 RepID=UPI0031CC5C12
MTQHEHTCAVQVTWTGNLGQGTNNYRAYARTRDHGGRQAGDRRFSRPRVSRRPPRYNPEACWWRRWRPATCVVFTLAAAAGVVVVAYEDQAAASWRRRRMAAVILLRSCCPTVTIQPGADPALAAHLHARAHGHCFIANSVNFPVT